MPSRLPNAFALGSPEDSAICVTDGLLGLLDGRELAGVLAHEIGHIASR
ncbi:M48 family metalloprotease, partial [Paracoccus salipaludis]